MTEENRGHCMSEVVCKLKHEADKRAMDLIVEQLHQRMNGMDSALVLRTQELERRLEGLNQLRDEVTKDRDQYVQKSVYDIKTSLYDIAMKDLTTRMTIQETRSVVWISVVGGGVVLLQLLLHWWSK